MGRRGAEGWLLAAAIAASACSEAIGQTDLLSDHNVTAGRAPTLSPDSVTYARDIAPILHENCAYCHRPGNIGPFSLLSHEDARVRGPLIVNVTSRRYMPPWLPEAGYGHFADERRLTDQEIELIRAWVEGGMPMGDSADLRGAPEWPDDWSLGEPDLVVTMSAPFELPASGEDVFRNFVIPLPVSETRYVRAVELRPDARAAVHHAVMKVDRTDSSRRLDESDPGPGFGGMDVVSMAQHPDGYFLGWTPGRLPHPGWEGLAWELEPNTDLVLQLHLRPTGKRERIGASVGLFFADTPPARTPGMITLVSEKIDIPPGVADYEVTQSFELPVGVDVLSVYPHAHLLGKEIRAYAELPDGSTEWLVYIEDWDFYWQDEYRLAEPLFLPAGTTLHMRYTFDNSSANPRNPNRPPRRVVHGNRSSDEMAELWIQALPRTAEDLETLDLALLEEWLEVNPSNPIVRYNLGVALAARGRHREAIPHYREAIRGNPDFPEAHNNLGNSLVQLTRIEEAEAAYRQAIEERPGFAEAHHNLGQVLFSMGDVWGALAEYRKAIDEDPRLADPHEKLGDALRSQGRLREAVPHYRRAVELEPDLGRAHQSLGMALAAIGQPAEAVQHLRRAIELTPDDPMPLVALAELLAKHPDPTIRSPDEAIRLAERAVELTESSHAVPLTVFAAACAAAGRYDDAVAAAERALALAQQAGQSALARSLRGQIASYRRASG